MAIKPSTLTFKTVRDVGGPVSQVQDNVRQAFQSLKKTSVNRDSICPVGSRVFWSQVLVPGTPDLPRGWVLCDGSALVDQESSLNGQTMPTEAGRIIRVK